MAKKRRRTPVEAASPALARLRANTLPLSRGAWLALAAILVAAIVAFAPAIGVPFVFDDVGSIPANPTIAHVFPLSVSLNPPARQAVSGRPATNLSLAIDHSVSRALGFDDKSTVVYHVTNIALHLLCGLLLFGLLRRTLALERLGAWSNANAELIALGALALWLLHPLQTEAVDYTIQRTELLVSVCYAATMYASLRAWAAQDRARLGWKVLSIVASVAGMASKEVMATAPFLVLFYDRVFIAPSWRAMLGDRDRRWLYACLFASLFVLAALVAGGGRADSVGFNLGLTWDSYLYSQGWAIAHYLRLLLLPTDLRFDYGDRPVLGRESAFGGTVLIALIVSAVVAWRDERRRWWAFVVFAFFVLLAPSSSIVPIRTEIAAERRAYLASFAIIAAVSVGLVALFKARRRELVAFLTVVALALTTTSFKRSAIYQSPERLWRDALEKTPNNPRAFDNLAAALYAQGPSKRTEAESLWVRAIALDSTYVNAWGNLAQLQMDEGRTADARATLQRGTRIVPQSVNLTERLAGLLAHEGDTTSIAYLERIAGSTSATDESLMTLGDAYVRAGRMQDAVTTLDRALKLNPKRADAAALLGAIFAQAGRFDMAVPYLRRAAQNGDLNPMTFALLSLGLAQSGQTEASVDAARRAAAFKSNDPKVYLAIGQAMFGLQQGPQAMVYLEEAVRLAPTNPEALTRLGIVKAASGDLNAATGLFQRALQVAPGYPPAAQALSRVR